MFLIVPPANSTLVQSISGDTIITSTEIMLLPSRSSFPSESPQMKQAMSSWLVNRVQQIRLGSWLLPQMGTLGLLSTLCLYLTMVPRGRIRRQPPAQQLDLGRVLSIPLSSRFRGTTIRRVYKASYLSQTTLISASL
jgi:hypothetical protein